VQSCFDNGRSLPAKYKHQVIIVCIHPFAAKCPLALKYYFCWPIDACPPEIARLQCSVMDFQPLIKRFGIWLLISFLILLLGSSQWDVKVSTAILFAGLTGLLVFLRFDRHNEKGAICIEEIISPDAIVFATIEEWTDDVSKRYIAKVKRNYQDGVFAPEQQFEAVEATKLWLEATFQQELAKHQQKILQTTDPNPNP
jgi:hypothetical protein